MGATGESAEDSTTQMRASLMDGAPVLAPPGAHKSSSSRSSEDPQDVSSEYSPMNVEDSSEAELKVWQRQYLGRILVVRLPGGIAYIGPHWYCSLIMLGFILSVGGYFIYCALTVKMAVSGILATVLSTYTFLRCALKNPGIVKASDVASLESESTELGEQAQSATLNTRRGNLRGRHCRHCDLIQPLGSSHCEFCAVCVAGYDHHCPWMGKCIGKKNLCSFYTFIFTALSSLAYIFMSTLLATPDTMPNARIPVSSMTTTEVPVTGVAMSNIMP